MEAAKISLHIRKELKATLRISEKASKIILLSIKSLQTFIKLKSMLIAGLLNICAKNNAWSELFPLIAAHTGMTACQGMAGVRKVSHKEQVAMDFWLL